MQNSSRSMNRCSSHFAIGLVLAMALVDLRGQPPGASPQSAGAAPDAAPEPLNWTTQQDHQNMKEQLGIKALRPGPSGRAGAPNSANYDPAKANPYPDLPDP